MYVELSIIGIAVSASEMTYIVSSGALNSTHSPGIAVKIDFMLK